MSSVATAQRLGAALLENLSQVILGKHEALEVALTALLAGGHLLCDDVPGVGKTVLSKAMARSLGCSFARLQCTADLLPSDILGVNVYNQKSGEFEFKRGPVFNRILLADEINRATPKAQSALLECMEERQVSLNGVCYPLEEPFIVLATQNPVEHGGTFPLPEAQLDRFMLTLELGYPSAKVEIDMLQQQQLAHPLSALKQVAGADDLAQAQAEVRQVRVSPEVCAYIVELVNFTRGHELLALGASPRGSQALYRASQARAAIQGRKFVIPDDVQALLFNALSHRLLPRQWGERGAVKRVLDEALQAVSVPVERA